MSVSLSPEQLLRLRLRAQHLTPEWRRTPAAVAEIVQAVGGLQAQEMPSAALSIRPRSANLTAAEIEQARVQERSVIRTWGQRYTLHLLAAADLPWLLPLFGPVFIAGSRSRRAELGLDEAKCRRGSELIRQVLADNGPLTRAEIVEQLARQDMALEGQAVPHLLGYCALQGIICHGPESEGEPTYVLLNDWIPGWLLDALPPEEAYQKLALRFLAAYAPATPEDMAKWSGLSLREIKAAWKALSGRLVEVEVANQTYWMLHNQQKWLQELNSEGPPVVRLLPRYDTYLLGYQNRELILDARFAKKVNAGGGILHPTILVNGRIVGTWKSARRKNRLEISLEPFEPLTHEAQTGLEAEANDIGRFLATESSRL
ncbi:MAG TPA: winged helix DNA-binding domain-containing protein [Chloroflexia bacterium]|nr:winged helix DNA-binding domain-containing protein [Chloroflexia bacterium]